MSIEDSVFSARAEAIAYIGYSLKSSGKVDIYLRKRGYDESVRSVVVPALIKDGYIDDYKICAYMAKSRSGKRAESSRRFFDRLIHAGISSDTASGFISDYPDDRQSIEELIDSKYSSDQFKVLSNDELYSTKIKMTRFLQSRGYRSGLIEEALYRRFNRVE